MNTTESDSGSTGVAKVAVKGGRTRAPEAASVVPHLSVAERVARGRAARGDAPRARVMRSSALARIVPIRSHCLTRRRRRGFRSWCRSGMGGCWCRRLRSIEERR